MDFEQLELREGYIRAERRLLTTEEGGRTSGGIRTGYRPNWQLGQRPDGETLIAGALMSFEGVESLDLGATAVVRLPPCTGSTGGM